MFDDDIFDFSDLFNKAWSQFKRPVLDQKPFMVKEVDKGYVIVVNTLGIDKNDLHVTLQPERGKFPVLKIVGETNLDKIGVKNQINLGITLKIDEDISELSYKCENGLTTILIETKNKRLPKEVTGKLIDSDGSLDW